jgi:hypothetical protein
MALFWACFEAQMAGLRLNGTARRVYCGSLFEFGFMQVK